MGQDDKTVASDRDRARTFFGIGATCIYAAGLAFLVYYRRQDIPKMELHEWADFLAGAFGPVAILWLILGYFQQGEDLRINTKALELQAQELNDLVGQQEKIVLLTQQQIDTAAARESAAVAQRLKESQPRFQFRIEGVQRWYDGKQQLRNEYRVTMTNVGSACSHMYFINESTELDVGIPQKRNLTNQEATWFTLIVPDTTMEEVHVSLFYQDALHNDRMQNMRVAVVPGENAFELILSIDEMADGFNSSNT